MEDLLDKVTKRVVDATVQSFVSHPQWFDDLLRDLAELRSIENGGDNGLTEM